jgi:hypothetical protein
MLVRTVPLERQDASLWRSVSGGSTSTKESGEEPAFFRGRGLLADEPHFSKLLQEARNVCEQLCARQAKFLFESVRNFIDGAPIFDHFPDPGSNRVQAETETLLDIEQDGTVLIDGFSYPFCHPDCGMVHLFGQVLLL